MTLSTKTLLTWLLATLVYYSGLLRLFAWIRGNQWPIILNYHRIANPPNDGLGLLSAMYVSPRIFERHLQYIARHFHAVTVSELVERQAKVLDVSRPLCAITFDDGWRDTFEQAFPLLRKYGLPATLFVSTDFIDGRRTPWFYRLGHALHSVAILSRTSVSNVARTDGIDLPNAIPRWFELSVPERVSQIDSVIEQLKKLPETELASTIEVLEKVASEAGRGTKPFDAAMLNWDEVRTMSRGGVEVGSHGVSHMILTNLSLEKAQEEIASSKDIVQQQLEQEVSGFSYPNGDVSSKIAELVQKAGYRYACTILPGRIKPETNNYRLYRLLLHGGNTFSKALFACHLAGFFDRGRR